MALLAEITSLLDPDWWVRNFGPLGVIVLGVVLLIRAFGAEVRACLKGHSDLVDELRLQMPRQTNSLERVERRQEEHTQQLTEIRSAVKPRAAS